MTNFCASAVKKLIIKKAGHFDEGAIFMTLRVFTNALCGALLTVIFALPAHAQKKDEFVNLKPLVQNLQYGFHQSNYFSISYDLAREAMTDIYKDGSDSNPLIGIAESDLNGDSYPEIISFPTEEEFETGRYCKKGDFCPHYILQVRDKEVYTLGVIYTNSLDVGDVAVNGYWTLRAYNKEYEGKKDYDVYRYDPKKDKFVFANTVTANPEPERKNDKKDKRN